MTEPARTTGSGPGCLVGLAAVAGLGALAWALLWFTVFRGADDPDSTAAASTDETPTATATPPGCEDVTGEFQGSAAGPGVEYVHGVCWESGGQLRVEIDLAADVNASAPAIVGLCAALTDFITASGRPWRGFTAYSVSPLTPGIAMLTQAEPDQPCTNPLRG